MIGLLCVTLFGLWAILQRQTIPDTKHEIPARFADKLDQLWQIAQQSLKEKRYLRAEKALLMILRVDERNASAYNRLGILYAKQKAYKDAIDCFEIAQSLEPSASSLHNVGLIYYETKDYEKASIAFEQALAIEDTSAARYIAYAKVQEKLGDYKVMIQALEKAIKLEPIPQTLNILADAYQKIGHDALALRLHEKAARMIIPQGKPKRIRQPRRVG